MLRPHGHRGMVQSHLTLRIAVYMEVVHSYGLAGTYTPPPPLTPFTLLPPPPREAGYISIYL